MGKVGLKCSFISPGDLFPFQGFDVSIINNMLFPIIMEERKKRWKNRKLRVQCGFAGFSPSASLRLLLFT